MQVVSVYFGPEHHEIMQFDSCQLILCIFLSYLHGPASIYTMIKCDLNKVMANVVRLNKTWHVSLVQSICRFVQRSSS